MWRSLSWLCFLALADAQAGADELDAGAIERARAARDVEVLTSGPYALDMLPAVARALGETRDARALAMLGVFAEMSSEEVRAEALDALGRVPQGIDLLRARMDSERSPSVRAAGWRAVGRAGGRQDVSSLVSGLSARPIEAAAAADGLAHLARRGIDTRAAVPVLLAALHRADPRLRTAVAHAIFQGRDAIRSPQAIEVLERARDRSARADVRAWLLGAYFGALSPSSQRKVAFACWADGTPEERAVLAGPLGLSRRHPGVAGMLDLSETAWWAGPAPDTEEAGRCPEAPVEDDPWASSRWRAWLWEGDACEVAARSERLEALRRTAEQGPFGWRDLAARRLARWGEAAPSGAPVPPGTPPWSSGPVMAEVVTTRGTVRVALDPEVAPRAVAAFVARADQDVAWRHLEGVPRVGPEVPLPADLVPSETSDRAATAGSLVWELEQGGFAAPVWSILLVDDPMARGRRTRFGHVLAGMDVVRRLTAGDRLLKVEIFSTEDVQ